MQKKQPELRLQRQQINLPQGETSPELAKAAVKEQVPETVAAHDDFDWSIDKSNVTCYTKDEKENTTKFMTTLSFS